MSSRVPTKDVVSGLDFGSPRIIAAMKVTGIEASEIMEPSTIEDNPNSARDDDASQRRMELMERKRRQLLRELDDAAAMLDETVVDAILAPSPSAASDARVLLASEKQKIDSKRERARSEMQKELQREIGRKKAYESSQRGREDLKKRTKEANDVKAEDVQKRWEEVERRHNKQEESLARTMKEDIAKRKETLKMLDESEKRVTKQADERRQACIKEAEERRKKMAEIAQKSLDIQQALEDDILRKAAIAAEKQTQRQERLEKAAHEALQSKRSKFADKMGQVSDTLKDQQMEREKTFKEHQERLERARQASRDHQADVSDRARTNREKEHEKWNSNRERAKKDNNDKVKKLRAELDDSHQKSIDVKEKWLEETVYKQLKTKGCMDEIVQQNKARIARSEECAREQTLAKIRHTKEKISSQEEQRNEAMKYRTAALRDEMVERTQLNEVKTVMRDASTKRINQLLKEMGMPILPTEGVKEEGEHDKQQ